MPSILAGRSGIIILVLFVLVALGGQILFLPYIELAHGLGYDGSWYHQPSLTLFGKVDNYHLFRIFPSKIAFFIRDLLGLDEKIGTTVRIFQVENLVFVGLTIWLLFKISAFKSYTGLKQMLFFIFCLFNFSVFKEFAFMLPSNEQIKLIFNPCITKGYVSRMQISANYGIGNRAYSSVEFNPKRIALEFLKGPVKSNDANYKNFKAFFDVKYIEYNEEEKLKITTNKPELNCFVPATLNNIIDIDIKKAKPLIFEPLNKFEIEKFTIKLSAQEIESFFGIIANDASITIDYNNDKGKHQIIGKSDYLMLGGQYACGVIQISCTKNNNNAFKSKQNQATFTIDELKKELISKGFERLNFDYKAVNEELWLTFFTQ